MKTLRVLLGILVLIMGLSVVANATLIDRGNGLIYDSDLNITWLQNANLASQKTFGVAGIAGSGQIGYWAAQSWLANMNSSHYLGYSNWRLPKTLPVNGSSYYYNFLFDGSADRGYNITAPGSAYPNSTGSEMAHLFYYLGNKAAYNTAGQSQFPFGVTNQGPFVNLTSLPAPFYVTTYVIFWSGTPYSGPPQFPNEEDGWSFRFDYGYQENYALDHSFYIWPVLDGDPAFPNVATPPPAISHLVLAINAGGAQYTGQTGTTYLPDSYYTAGQSYSTTQAVTIPPSYSAPAVDGSVYQSIHYGNFAYNIPLANGNYTVTLKFAEIYWTGVGERIFNVSMQGLNVLNNLDIFAQVGRNASYDVTFPASVTNGVLNINFTSVVDSACISAIVIQSASFPGAPPAIQVNPTSLSFTTAEGTNPTSKTIGLSNVGGGTLNWTAVADSSTPAWLSVTPGSGANNATLTASIDSANLAPGKYSKNITITAAGATNTPQIIPVTLNVNPKSTSAVVFADHAGGGQYTDQAGIVYQADANYSGGSAASTTSTISGTADSALYQSQRYGNFSYNVPLANGNYIVTLKFAEIFWTGAGQRVFNVNMQGQNVISNLDIFAQVGKNAAYDIPVPVSVTNGILNIQFSSIIDSAGVNAIVVQSTSFPGASPVIQLSPTSLSFAAGVGTNPPSQPMGLSNIGGGTLNWTAVADSSAPAWLSIDKGSGTGNATLSVSVNSSNLTAGKYTKNITVSAPGATNTPQVAAVTLSVNPAGIIFANNAGGNQYTDHSGVSYQSDGNYSGGATASTSATIAGTPDSSLYQSVRYGNFAYNIPLANGNYTVTLKLAEVYWTAAGRRVFDVSMQGQKVVSALDIFAHVGTNAAYDYAVPVTVTNGVLNIQFASIADNACVSAIVVQSTSSSGAPTILLNPASLNFVSVAGTNPANQTIGLSNAGSGTLTWTAVADSTAPAWLSVDQGSGANNATLTISVNSAGLAPGQYSKNITISATGATNTPQIVTVTLTVNSNGPGSVVFANHAGGGQITDQSSVVYQADTDYSGGATAATSAPITGTVDGALYQTLRYGNFSYNIPLANGSYNVTLKFAEIYWGLAGQRIFNVNMQGQNVISNLDIVAQVGKNAAYDISVPVSVANGILNIQFASVLDYAIVNAIKITK